MKVMILSLAVTSLCLASSISSTEIGVEDVTKLSEPSSLLACGWFPLCGDPDIYSPILQPKGDKTETQDTKDEKLA